MEALPSGRYSASMLPDLFSFPFFRFLGFLLFPGRATSSNSLASTLLLGEVYSHGRASCQYVGSEW